MKLHNNVALKPISVPRNFVQNIPNQLIQEISRLQTGLFSIVQVEKKISELMVHPQDDSNACGSKHGNLVRLAWLIEALGLEGVKVPLPHGISNAKVTAFLKKNAPHIFDHWRSLDSKKLLVIQEMIKSVFLRAGDQLLDPELLAWLEEVQDYIMVRSSGAEDSQTSANAGGNMSCAYIAPTKEAFCHAAGEVVASYFSEGSLKNRINAGENPFESDLKLSFTAQDLIGEAVGGTSKDIPISLVLFTSEPLYVGDEHFRVMRISATYGHGEGVVGAQGIASDTILLLVSDAHPDQLYVMYDNQKKPERLAPVQTKKGIVLLPVANPKELQKSPVLNEELLARLYTLGVLTEMFFGDKANDMEIVIKNGVIYPVQARPIHRLPLLPTYLDKKKAGSITPSLESKVLVTGRGNVIVVKDPKEVKFANSLEIAEKTFDKNVHKVVIVTQPEPANSHPVVNFSLLGITCLKVNQGDIINKITPEHPLVVDSQTGDIYLWNGDPSSCISEGFAVHPAKLALSVSKTNVRKTKSQPSQDVKELLTAVRSATTHKAVLKIIQKLRKIGTVEGVKESLAAKISESSFVPRRVEKAQIVLDDLHRAIQKTFDETIATLNASQASERLRPLIRIKALETLLIGSDSSGIGQYSLPDAEGIFKDAVDLLEYQKKFNFPVHFSKIYLAANAAVDPSSVKTWRAFLESIDLQVYSGVVSLEKVEQLHQLIKTLERTGVLTQWFVFFFKEKTTLDELLATLSEHETELTETCLTLAKRSQSMRNGISSFSDPHTFEEAFDRLTNLCDELKREGIDQLMSASPIAQLMILQTLLDVVDLFDSAVKEMKRGAWTQREKVPLFRRMLEPYHELLQKFVRTAETKLVIPLHADWPLYRYLFQLNECFKKISDNITELDASPNYSCTASMLGSATLLDRHLPLSAEDLFTLIHQNLIFTITNFMDQIIKDLLAVAALPKDVKMVLGTVTEYALKRKVMRTGIDISDQQVCISYNVPLRSHSAKMVVKYDRDNGEMTLQGIMMGLGRVRWPDSAMAMQLLSNAGRLPLKFPPFMTAQELRLEWVIENEKRLRDVLSEFNELCEFSFEWGIDYFTPSFSRKYGFDKNELAKFAAGLTQHADPEFRVRAVKLVKEHLCDEAALEAVHHLRGESNETVMLALTELYKEMINKKIGIQEAIQTVKVWATDPRLEVHKMTSVLLINLVETHLDFNEAILIANLWLESSEYEIQRDSFYLFLLLVNQKQGFNEAYNAVIKGINSTDFLMHPLAMSLLKTLVEKKQKLDEALTIASTQIERMDNYGIQLFRALVKKGRGIPEAIQAAQAGIKKKEIVNNNPVTNLYNQSLKLFEDLVRKGHAFDEAVAAAVTGFEWRELNVKLAALDLFICLVNRDCGFEEAKAIVNSGIVLQDYNMITRMRSLKESLVTKGQLTLS